MQLFEIFIAGFASVFLLGFQSRNVNSGHFVWAACTSFLIAIAQASVWAHVTAPSAGMLGSVVYGLSGATGITTAMWAHRRVFGTSKRQ